MVLKPFRLRFRERDADRYLAWELIGIGLCNGKIAVEDDDLVC
jgi:hypothetical protein